MKRRGFILGASSLLTAPALVRASSLEYVPRARAVESLYLHQVITRGTSGEVLAVDYVGWGAEDGETMALNIPPSLPDGNHITFEIYSLSDDGTLYMPDIVFA